MLFINPPKTHGPWIVSATNVGPADHFSVPRLSSVAVGNWNTGPAPQIMLPGFAGEMYPWYWISPRPNSSPTPGASSGWYIKGVITLLIRFQFSAILTGITGWTLRIYWRSSSGPTPKLKLFWKGTLMRSLTGFWLFLARSDSWAFTSFIFNSEIKYKKKHAKNIIYLYLILMFPYDYGFKYYL